jgi:hypothetical protein
MSRVWVAFVLLAACDKVPAVESREVAMCASYAVILGSSITESISGTCDPRATATLQQIGGKTIMLCSCPVFQPTKDMH